MADPKVRADRTLAPALVKAFEEAKDDDPRVRQYLALAIGRLDPPLPPEAVAGLTQALDDPDGEARISAIWALGSSGDPAVVPRLQPLYALDRTPASARWWSTRSARCPATRRSTRCARARGRAPDVRWNAAVALARHGSHDGVPVLRQMLDRGTSSRRSSATSGRTGQDPMADVMISGLRAAAALKDQSLRPSVTS